MSDAFDISDESTKEWRDYYKTLNVDEGPKEGATYIVRYRDHKPEAMQWGCGGHNVWRNCAGTISDPEDITVIRELDVADYAKHSELRKILSILSEEEARQEGFARKEKSRGNAARQDAAATVARVCRLLALRLRGCFRDTEELAPDELRAWHIADRKRRTGSHD